MHGGVLQTYQLEFVFMTVLRIPTLSPSSLKKGDTAGHALCVRLNDLNVAAIDKAFTG